jgi:hypothetical protein
MLADMSWLTRLGFVADAQGRRADEAALLARVLRGDAQALALLYRRESGPVYRYALALVGDEGGGARRHAGGLHPAAAQPARLRAGAAARSAPTWPASPATSCWRAGATPSASWR